MRSNSYAMWAGLFTVAYFLGFLAWVIYTGQPTASRVQLLIMAVLVVTVAALHGFVSFSRIVLWSLSLWGLAHLCGALIELPPDAPQSDDTTMLYSLYLLPHMSLRYDMVVHFLGFGVMTWACWEMLRAVIRSDADGRGKQVRAGFASAALAAFASMGFGALNEVVEFIATELLPGNSAGGYINTADDLVSNLCGSVTAAAILYVVHHTNLAGRATKRGHSSLNQ